MGKSQIKIGSILSYVQMALNVIIGLLYTPLMIRLLGDSEYGLYNTVASTVSMLSILSFGFGSSYIKFFAKYKANNDQDSICKLNGLFLIVFSIIGIIALVCGLFLTNNLDIIFSDGLTTTEYHLAKQLLIICTLNLALTFPMTVFTNIITAHEQFICLKLVGMTKTVLSPMLTIPLLLLGYGSMMIVTVTLLISVITDIIYLYYVIVRLKSRFIFHNFERGLFKEIWRFASFIAINIIIDQVNWNIDKIMLGRYHGTKAVAVYSVGASLNTYYQMFSGALSGLFTPRIHRIVNENILDTNEKKEQLTSIFVCVGRIQYLILALIASGFVFLGKNFIVFWAGDGYEQSYYVALLLILPITVPLIQNLGIEIQRAENKHQFRSIVYAIMAIINLIITIYLAQHYGAIGAVVGTAISLILANGIIMNIYYHKRCGIDIIEFWKNIIIMSRGLIVPVIFGIFVYLVWEIDSILEFLFGIICYFSLYCLSMWKWGMNEQEKQFIAVPLSKLFNRKKIKNNIK